MSGLFVTIVNMSLTASYVALVVMLIRCVLARTRAPKVFSYALWLPVMFRLVFPFSLESPLSLIPGNLQAFPLDSPHDERSGNPGGPAVGDTGTALLPAALTGTNATASADPMDVLIELGAWIWALGGAALLICGFVSYFGLKRRLAFATLVKDNVFETDRISTPFVLGMFNPRIYMPTGLTAQEQALILLHEQTHIRRLDYLIKPLAFLVVIMHWFNPLVWLSYFLMIKDMEMACDERVMAASNGDLRADYSRTLLALASRRSGLFSPLSFGESNVKARIRNILRFKRPALRISAAAAVGLAALAVTLMVNPTEGRDMKAEEAAVVQVVEQFGRKLQAVSLLAPKSEVERSMLENYSDFAARHLIAAWVEDPDNAPGRLTSSPWPDRIDITSVRRVAKDTYEVQGRIVEVAVAGMGETQVVATRSVTLEVKRNGDRWLIDQLRLGPYE
jgi:beta-lactamase regulating signal transducer with metallopeptidase domain